MRRPFRKRDLLWLAFLLLVVLPVLALGVVRMLGWHWQGVGWRHGLTVERVWWQAADCLRLDAQDVRLTDVWPLTLNVDRLRLPNCAATKDASLRVPLAPPFDVAIRALHYRDYPSLQVTARHRGGHWSAQAALADSLVHADYDASEGAWQVQGQVVTGNLDQDIVGVLHLQGSGVWQPGAARPEERVRGRLRIRGKNLGIAGREPRGNLSGRLAWQGQAWTLRAALDQPIALGQGWVVSPGRGVIARGQGMAVEQATAEVMATGPQSSALLSLHSSAHRLGRGRGRLVLDGDLAGRVDLGWQGGAITVQPFTVSAAEGVSLTLNRAMTVTLAKSGAVAPDLTLRYRQARVGTTDSHLRWRADGVRWQGNVVLGGQLHGLSLRGGWSGSIGSAGVQGQPLTLALDGRELRLRAQVPVTGLKAPDWSVTSRLQGSFRGVGFSGTLSGGRENEHWGGVVHASARLPGADQGGQMRLDGQWRWQDGLQVRPGAEVSLSRALRDKVLIRPARLFAATPVTIDGNGLEGRFRFDAEGLVTARWLLPALQGELDFHGQHFDADLRVPAWNATLAVAARDLNTTPRGTLDGTIPLRPAISRGLGVTTRDGRVTLTGSWRGGAQPSFRGELQGTDVALAWGSVQADDLRADLALRWHPGHFQVYSRQPLTLARLDVGIPITDIRLAMATDLKSWVFRDIDATLLGGSMSAPALVWPSSDYQPVTLTGIQVAQLAALQSKPVVNLSGSVGGTMPLQLQRHTLAIRAGTLANETPLSLSIPQTESVRALEQSSQAVQVALDAINPLRIDYFRARLDMDAAGWLDAAATIKGINPAHNALPVVFHYTHRENVLDLLRGLRIGDRITDAVMKGVQAGSANPEMKSTTTRE